MVGVGGTAVGCGVALGILVAVGGAGWVACGVAVASGRSGVLVAVWVGVPAVGVPTIGVLDVGAEVVSGVAVWAAVAVPVGAIVVWVGDAVTVLVGLLVGVLLLAGVIVWVAVPVAVAVLVACCKTVIWLA